MDGSPDQSSYKRTTHSTLEETRRIAQQVKLLRSSGRSSLPWVANRSSRALFFTSTPWLLARQWMGISISPRLLSYWGTFACPDASDWDHVPAAECSGLTCEGTPRTPSQWTCEYLGLCGHWPGSLGGHPAQLPPPLKGWCIPTQMALDFSQEICGCSLHASIQRRPHGDSPQDRFP